MAPRKKKEEAAKTVSVSAQIASAQTELLSLKMKHQAGELKQTHLIKAKRKEIARLKTASHTITL